MESFDHGNAPKVFWGDDGDVYSTEKDRVYFATQGAVLKCFDVEAVNHKMRQASNYTSREFDLHKGHRFDSQGHSWILMEGNIMLSFSYMTFVISKKF